MKYADTSNIFKILCHLFQCFAEIDVAFMGNLFIQVKAYYYQIICTLRNAHKNT